MIFDYLLLLLFNNCWPHVVKDEEMFTDRDLPTQILNSFPKTRGMKFYHLRFKKVDETALHAAAGYRGH